MLISFVRWIAGQDAPVRQQASNRDPLPTTPLRRLGEPRSTPVGAASAPVELSAACEAVSLTLVGCNARIRVGAGAVVALASDHRLLDGERLDLAVDPGSAIAVIAEGGTGTLSVSELL